MSQYTTGEVAKLCGVTVRTVQYYDTRGILPPSQLSEGGRRLYSEQDLQRMKFICFLRELGLSISTISQLMAEEHPEKVIGLLLQRQADELRDEIGKRQEKLDKLTMLQKGLKGVKGFSLESMSDIATTMENKKKLRRVRWNLAIMAVAMVAVNLAACLIGGLLGIWWPIALIGVPFVLGMAVWVSVYYFRNVAYICPECNQTFQPKFREAFWAVHTPTTRRLTCPHCGHKLDWKE